MIKGSIGIIIGSFAPRGVEGGSFARIGLVNPIVNEGPMSKAAVGVSRMEAKFAPHIISPLSPPKAPSIRIRVPDVFQRGLANINLDPAKPAWQLVPDAKLPVIKPVIQAEVIRLAQVRQIIETAKTIALPAVDTQLKQRLHVVYPHVLSSGPIVAPANKLATRTSIRPVISTSPKTEAKTVEPVAQIVLKAKKEAKLNEPKKRTKVIAFVKDKAANMARYLALITEVSRQFYKAEKGGIINLGEVAEILLPNKPEYNSAIRQEGPDWSKSGLVMFLKAIGSIRSFKEADNQIQKGIEDQTAVAIASDGEKIGFDKVENVLEPKHWLFGGKSLIEVVLEKVAKIIRRDQVQVGNGEVKIQVEESRVQEQTTVSLVEKDEIDGKIPILVALPTKSTQGTRSLVV